MSDISVLEAHIEKIASGIIKKQAFQDAAAIQQVMSPESLANIPPVTEGMPPVDPSMLGGLPPVDPAMGAMGVDPAMMGAMPADPAMAAGAPPAADPAMMDAVPAGLTEERVAEMIAEAGGKKKPGGSGKMDPAVLDKKLNTVLIALTAIASQLGVVLPPDIMLAFNDINGETVEESATVTQEAPQEAGVPAGEEVSGAELVAPAKEAALSHDYVGTPYVGAGLHPEVQRTLLAQRLNRCKRP